MMSKYVTNNSRIDMMSPVYPKTGAVLLNAREANIYLIKLSGAEKILNVDNEKIFG
jgi:hypothetical protein